MEREGSQTHQVHNFPPYFPKIHSSIIFPSMPISSEWSLPIKCEALLNEISFVRKIYTYFLKLWELITYLPHTKWRNLSAVSCTILHTSNRMYSGPLYHNCVQKSLCGIPENICFHDYSNNFLTVIGNTFQHLQFLCHFLFLFIFLIHRQTILSTLIKSSIIHHINFLFPLLSCVFQIFSYPEGRTQTEGVSEQGAGEDCIMRSFITKYY